MSFLVGVRWFVGRGRLTVLEIWMAHCVFMPGAAFCLGDDRHHEHTALCDTSEHLAFVIVGMRRYRIYVLQGQGQSAKEVLSRIDFGGLFALFLMVGSSRAFHSWLRDLFRARLDRHSFGSARGSTKIFL